MLLIFNSKFTYNKYKKTNFDTMNSLTSSLGFNIHPKFPHRLRCCNLYKRNNKKIQDFDDGWNLSDKIDVKYGW